ncbi:MAG: hypothetical protein JXP34_22870 [Planctomycetes bacterium]|nr:hypothetical protein [Planctomycetota bacterium]
MMRRIAAVGLGGILSVLALAAPASPADPPRTIDDFLARIRGEDRDARYEAIRGAGAFGAAAVAPLAVLMGDANPLVADGARQALESLARHAGRPDSDDRLPVAEALAKVLAASSPAKAREKALELLGEIGGNAEIPAMAALIADPGLRDAALAAIDRIPGEASERALLAALDLVPKEALPSVIVSIEHHGCPSATARIVDLAADGNPRIRAAAVECLGAGAGIAGGDAAAVRPAVRAVMRSIRDDAPEVRRVAGEAYLRLAGVLAAAGRREPAFWMLRALVERRQEPAWTCAAMVGLSKLGGSDAADILTGALVDPSATVREAAKQGLVDLGGDEIDAHLIGKLDGAAPPARASILRVLFARRSPQAAALIKEASRDADLEVRVTALDLLGGLDDPAFESIIYEAIEKGSPQVMSVALGSYIRLTAARLAAGKTDEALSMYTRALNLAREDGDRRAVLAGIAAIADPSSLDVVRGWIDTPGTRDDAQRAVIAIAATIGRSDAKRAIEMLSEVVSSTSSLPIASLAMAKMRELGADTTGFAAKAGFIANWFILGPLPYGDGDPWDKTFFDPAKVDTTASVSSGDRQLIWRKHQTDDLTGRVRMHEFLAPKDNVCAFAYAEIRLYTERKLRFRIGSDDGVIAWLNGERIHANDTTRALGVDQDTVDVVLKEGVNRILLKINQGGGEWEFCLRIADRQNRPLDLTKLGTDR